MARGSANNEPIVSQANTEEFRDGYERTFGTRRAVRGSWVVDRETGKLVPADQYRPPAYARDAPIIADRIHEGTTFDDGERVRDLGSRRKRREFMRETGMVEASDASRGWLEARRKQRERDADRRTDSAFTRATEKLYTQRKLPR